MTLFIVPVFYDIIYRKKEMKAVDIGDEETLKADEAAMAEGIGDVDVEEASENPATESNGEDRHE